MHNPPVVSVGRLSLALDEGADEPLPAPEEHPVAVLLGLPPDRDLDLLHRVVLALAPPGHHAALLRPASNLPFNLILYVQLVILLKH